MWSFSIEATTINTPVGCLALAFSLFFKAGDAVHTSLFCLSADEFLIFTFDFDNGCKKKKKKKRELIWSKTSDKKNMFIKKSRCGNETFRRR